MASNVIYVECDNLVEYLGAKNAQTNAYLNAATVTFTLYESDGTTPVSGATSVAMAYDTGSNGDYYGTLQSTVSLVATHQYVMQVDLVQAGIVDQRRWNVTAVVRGRAAG